jgi:hypothetical protein
MSPYLVTGTFPEAPKYSLEIPRIAHNPDESRNIPIIFY